MKKLIFLLVVVVTALLFVTSQASALSFNSLIVSGANQASDENREYLIDHTYNADPNGPDGIPGNTDDPTGVGIVGQLDVGDVLRGSININTMNSGSANVGGNTGVDEMTGVFQIEIVSKSFSHIDGPSGLSYYNLGFGPDLNWVEPNSNLGGANGVMVVMFEDSANNFAADFDDPAPSAPPATPDDGTVHQILPPSNADVSVGPYVTEENFLATATDGTWWGALGLMGQPGEVAAGVGHDNVMPAFTITSASTLGLSNFGFNLVATGPAWDPLISINRITPVPGGGPVDFALSQSVRGVYDLDTPWELSSNTNISFNATVIPEPATMFLLGSGLIGMAGLARRKKKV
ncbi:MAG: PEP-CTERM sorting domain-containing protein [Candidatus Omnitrophica bacterium]|nr:PEP-CTERM sorting domain-containing protein [Candidatus Omnitrophota bacterium]